MFSRFTKKPRKLNVTVGKNETHLGDKEIAMFESVGNKLPEKEFDIFQGFVQNYNSILELLDMKKANSQLALDKAQQELKEAKEALSKEQEKNKDLQTKNAEVQQTLSDAQKKNIELEKRIKKYEEVIQEADAQYEDLQKKVEAENQQHQKAKEDLVKEIEAARNKHLRVLKENLQLKDQVSDLQNEVKVFKEKDALLLADTVQTPRTPVRRPMVSEAEAGDALINSTAIDSPASHRGEGEPEAEEEEGKENIDKMTLNQKREALREKQIPAKPVMMSGAGQSAASIKAVEGSPRKSPANEEAIKGSPKKRKHRDEES